MRSRTTCLDPEVGRLLAAYDAGVLAPHEQTDVERHLEVCEACQEELYELAPHITQLHRHAERAARRLDGGGEVAAASRPAEPLRLRSWLSRLRPPAGPIRRWTALAPVAVAIVALVVILGERDSVESRLTGGPPGPVGAASERAPQSAQIEPLPFARIETRAGGDPALDEFDAGMALYLAADHGAAAARLSAAERQLDRLLAAPGAPAPARARQRADQAALYAGVAFLLADRADSARVHLRRAQASQLAMVADHARWYSAQSALRDGDRAAAVELLRHMAAASPAYGQRATAQLEALGESASGRAK